MGGSKTLLLACYASVSTQQIRMTLGLIFLVAAIVPLISVRQVALAQFESSNSIEGQQQQQTIPNNNFLTYQNSTYGITIQYPAGWLIHESHGEVPHGIVLFRTPLETTFASLNVYGGDLLPYLSFQQYVDGTIYQLRNQFQNFNLIESSPTSLDGYQAQKLIYTTSVAPDNTSMEGMSILTIKDDREYIITYVTQTIDFQTYLPTIQKMIDSFAFLT